MERSCIQWSLGTPDRDEVSCDVIFRSSAVLTVESQVQCNTMLVRVERSASSLR